MIPFIFVYGTLVSSHGHPMGSRLRQEALLVGPAQVAGRLHRISWYPGLRPAEAATDRVHGEVYKLADPKAALAWLDEYEGIAPGAASVAKPDMYARVVCPATTTVRTTIDCWLYLYQLPAAAGTWVPDGIWRG